MSETTTAAKPLDFFETASHEQGRAHISFLMHPLGWTTGAEALLAEIAAVHKIAATETLPVALGCTGAYDILCMPNNPLFQVVPNVERRSLPTDMADAGALIPLIGNNGLGPDSPDEVIEALRDGHAQAVRLGRPVSASGWAGLYDAIVRPDGTFFLTPQVAGGTKTLVESNSLF